LVVAVLAVAFAGCGSSGGNNSFVCNDTTTFACATTSVSSGTITNPTCNGSAVIADSCATANLIGKCTLTSTATVSGTTVTTTIAVSYYTGATAPASSSAGCTAGGGTWTNP
jgi:hypothetical protein